MIQTVTANLGNLAFSRTFDDGQRKDPDCPVEAAHHEQHDGRILVKGDGGFEVTDEQLDQALVDLGFSFGLRRVADHIAEDLAVAQDKIASLTAESEAKTLANRELEREFKISLDEMVEALDASKANSSELSQQLSDALEEINRLSAPIAIETSAPEPTDTEQLSEAVTEVNRLNELADETKVDASS